MRMLLHTVYRHVAYANSPVTMEAQTRQSLIFWVLWYLHIYAVSGIHQWVALVGQPCQLIISVCY